MLNNINVKSDQSLWRALLQEIQSACRHSKAGMVAEGSLLRRGQKWVLVLAEFSVDLRALLPLCALAKNDHFMPWLTEECCQASIQLQGTGQSLLTRGQEVLGNSAMAWEPLSSLCRETMSKKHISNQCYWWKKGVGQRHPCLQTEKAALLASFIGYGPLLHWAPIQPALDLHGIAQIAEPAGIKMQESNWKIILPAPL